MVWVQVYFLKLTVTCNHGWPQVPFYYQTLQYSFLYTKRPIPFTSSSSQFSSKNNSQFHKLLTKALAKTKAAFYAEIERVIGAGIFHLYSLLTLITLAVYTVDDDNLSKVLSIQRTASSLWRPLSWRYNYMKNISKCSLNRTFMQMSSVNSCTLFHLLHHAANISVSNLRERCIYVARPRLYV